MSASRWAQGPLHMGSTPWDRISLEPPIVGSLPVRNLPGRHRILRDTRNHCKMLVVMSLKRQSKAFAGNIGRQKRQNYATWLMIAGLRSVLHRWTVSSPKLYRLTVFRVTPLHPALNMACSWVKYPSKSGTVLEVFPGSETSRWLGKYVSLTQHCAVASDQPTRTLGCQVYKTKNNIHKVNNQQSWRQQSTQTS